jgi:hypothetical protein
LRTASSDKDTFIDECQVKIGAMLRVQQELGQVKAQLQAKIDVAQTRERKFRKKN